MGIIKDIRNSIGKRLLDVDESDWALFGGLGGYRANDLVGQRSDEEVIGYYRTWVKTAIDAIAEKVAETKFELRDKNGELVDDHELLKVLKKPNPYTTKSQFLIRLVAYYYLTGKAPIYKFLGKKSKRLILLPPNNFHAKWNNAKDMVVGFENRVGSKTNNYELEEIIPLFSFNPESPMDGYSTTRANAYGIESLLEMENWVYRFFSNGGIPPFAISYDQKLTKEQVDKVKTRLLQEYSGSNNAFAPLVLSGGAKTSKTGLSPKDVELSETERAIRDKVLGQFRVPKAIVGAVDDVNRANAEASLVIFMQNTVKPLVTLITEVLNVFWVDDWGDGYELTFKDPVPRDRLTDVKVKEVRGKWVTVDELRAEEGLEPLPDGKGEVLVGQSPISINMDSVDRKFRRLDEKIERFKLAKSVTKEEDDDAIIKMLDRQAKSYEGRWIKTWAKYSNELEDRLITSLRDTKSIRMKEISSDVFNEDKEVQIIIDLLEQFYGEIAEEAILDAIALAGYDDLDFETVLRRVIRTHTPILEKSSMKIGTTLKNRISSELIKGIEEGEGIDDLIQRVQKNTRWMKEVQAEAIAQTETTKVTNGAFYETYTSGNAPYKGWVNLGDSRVRDDHKNENIAELVVPMEDTFYVGEEHLKYPGDPNGDAENVIRCRCRIVARYELPEKSVRHMTKEYHNLVCGCGRQD